MNNSPSTTDPASISSTKSAAEIEQWIVRELSETLHVGHDKIRLDQPLLGSGIDSVQVVSLMSNLEDWVGVRFTENPLDDHPTPAMLAQFVSNLNHKSSSST